MKYTKDGFYKAINWNELEDKLDKVTWEKLISQFWLDTRIPVSNDLDDWRLMKQKDKDLINKVFGGLTLLDTMQSQDGAHILMTDAVNQKESAVLSNIMFMESVHAKSYSTIFSTLCNKQEIEEIFDWIESNEFLQYKAKYIEDIYKNGTPIQRKVASVLLESFLFYSGFFTPLYYYGQNKLMNVGEIIRLIIRDECLSEKHDLLTPVGWKPISQIREGDLVLAYVDETDVTEFQPVIKTSTHIADKIFRFTNSSKNFVFETSPNHRVLSKNKSNKSFITKAIDLDKKPSQMIIHARPTLTSNLEFSLWDELFVAIKAKGVFVSESNDSVLVRFNLSSDDNVNYFKDLLNKLNITPDYYNDKKENFNISVPADVFYKEIDFSNINLLKYFEASIFSMNAVKHDDKVFFDVFFNKEFSDFIQTISSLLGYKTKLSKDNYDRLTLYVYTNNNTTGLGSLIKEELKGQQVYGVEVPSGFLVTRCENTITITGNSVHGTYIGYKHQILFNELTEEEQEEHKSWVYKALFDLYENEVKYTQQLYDEVGWTEKVKTFIRYNANKALQNLGFEPLFPETDKDVDPVVMNGISTESTNHDFFSSVGNSYLVGEVEAMSDDDYNIM